MSNPDMQSVVKALVMQFGEDIILDSPRLLSLSDDRLKNNAPEALERIRLAIYADVPRKLYDMKSVDEYERRIRMKVIFSVLTKNYNEETSYDILNSFAYVLGYEPIKPSPALVTSEQSSNELTTSNVKLKHSSGLTVTPKAGTILSFGGYEWRVLEVRENNALIITEHIIDQRRYDSRSNRWGQGCELYDWLNGEFYEEISWGNNGRIASKHNITNDNPWYPESKGSGKTIDKVFLLSLEEVCRYFGDSTVNLRQKGSTGSDWFINDGNNTNRIATYNGTASWWWLRSPGYDSDNAAHVGSDGLVYVGYYGIVEVAGGVRPALWLNL